MAITLVTYIMHHMHTPSFVCLDFVEKDFDNYGVKSNPSSAETATVAADPSNGAGAGSHMKEAALRSKVVKANNSIHEVSFGCLSLTFKKESSSGRNTFEFRVL